MMEFYNERHHVARKCHVCECCRSVISPKEKYVVQTGKFEGDFFSRKWCLDCEIVMNYYFDALATDEYFDYDDVDYDIQDVFCCRCDHHHNDDCEQLDRWHCPLIQKKIEEYYTEHKQRAEV